MPRLELYPFVIATPEPASGCARYVAELHEIAARYAEYEMMGPPEIRDVPDDLNAHSFSPWRRPLPRLRYPVIEAS